MAHFGGPLFERNIMNKEEFYRGALLLKEGTVLPGFLMHRPVELWDQAVADQDVYFNIVEGVFIVVGADTSKPFFAVKNPTGGVIEKQEFFMAPGSEYHLAYYTDYDEATVKGDILKIKNPSAGRVVSYADENNNVYYGMSYDDAKPDA
uniref:Uncharacterized protein n=1 Tax=Serratia phage Kevin TaxID=3161161 RepID=A0AAU8KYU9_9CAUD